jgi:hypothetical protein
MTIDVGKAVFLSELGRYQERAGIAQIEHACC